jgi:hypothetical protein
VAILPGGAGFAKGNLAATSVKECVCVLREQVVATEAQGPLAQKERMKEGGCVDLPGPCEMGEGEQSRTGAQCEGVGRS